MKRPAETARESFKEMQKIARGVFLTQREGRAITLSQFGPHERPNPAEPNWEMHETLREIFLKRLSDPAHFDWAGAYNRVLREASGQVAKVAHFRAQEGRTQTALSNQTMQWQDMLRDIQAHEAFMASIDPDMLMDGVANTAQLLGARLYLHTTAATFGAGARQEPAVDMAISRGKPLSRFKHEGDLTQRGHGRTLSRLRVQSRYHFVNGPLPRALSYARMARIECKEGHVSHGMRMQAL